MAAIIIGIFVLTTLTYGAYRVAAIRRRSRAKSAQYQYDLLQKIVVTAQRITANNAEKWLRANDGTVIRLHTPVNGRYAMERLPNGQVDYERVLDVEYIVLDGFTSWIRRMSTTISDTQSVALTGMMRMFNSDASVTDSTMLRIHDLRKLFAELAGVSE